ncbi:LysR family transcriptional regulator [Pseudomonas rhodesiae]|jgi:DNA-binding transcriptional LysR family regulator|uniref:LysR family transcriptional regulator n=1 Tax=Pseudomonas rhodesiae TaxID=76760 RepID=A0A8I1JEN0_9PSED|nr:LysR family transcriptional regulator [Pseudomonas rhodesiae]MBI6626237.1 LysR family transcriptional regulator [Pseudomonas rhodesiae]
MSRKNFSQMLAFINVVREGSFTRAAAVLGVSPSALSHAVRGLETQVGVQLLTRTTRSISTTEAGERLFLNVSTRLEEIDAELEALDELRDSPVGTVRITTAEHAANSILWPKLSSVLSKYPEIIVEITVDYTMRDIVSQGYDAGVRMGNQVAKDMIAVRIGPDLRIAVVGSPEYFANRNSPATPHDLAHHNCINLRLATHGGLLPWDFEKDGQEIKLRVSGQWVFNNSSSIVRAALAGYGLAFVPEDMVREHIAEGQLVRVLDDWCDLYPGYHLYYPNRKEFSRALSVVVDALRHQES